MLIPHHQGRDRAHIEFKKKVNLVKTISLQIKDVVTTSISNDRQSKQIANENTVDDSSVYLEIDQARPESNYSNESAADASTVDFGKICRGRRVDYVLQEHPLESMNSYLFAVASHACYWQSEDTLLFIVKEIYETGQK
jgi:hypothetical protein